MKFTKYFMTVSLALTASFLFSFALYAEENDDTIYITGVGPISTIYVPAMTTFEEALPNLPNHITITVSEGDPFSVDVDWEFKEYVDAARGEPRLVKQSWLPWTYGDHYFVGTFDLPDGVYQPENKPVPLEIEVSIFLLPRPRVDWSFTGFNIDGYPDILRRGFDQPGTYRSGSINVDGAIRTYHYYLPTSYDGNEPVPLVLDFHGAGSYGIGQALHSDFHRVAEKNGFIPVWSDGLDARHGIDDVPYISALIDKFSVEYNIDLRRVYATGMSNGSGMAMILAFEIPERLAAVGIVSSASTGNEFNRSIGEGKTIPAPMPFLLSVGTQDGPYYPSSETIYAMLDYFNGLNQTDANPWVTEWFATDDDQTSITRSIWEDGIFGSEVRYYRVAEAGHTWPGSYTYAAYRLIGHVSQHVNQSEELWDFFKRHSLPMETTITISQGAINPNSNGVIKVTIPSTDNFDATAIDPATVRFGPAGAKPVRYNITGNRNMIMHFNMNETGIQAGDTAVKLTGNSLVDGAFWGTDSIRTVPAR